MTIHIEYLPAIDRWVMTINGEWIITSASFDMVAAALADRIPAFGRVAKSA
jgi:hypothetical protein